MASQPWNRRRVQALPMLRASDGSAFEKCQKCGISVAIALFDMHAYECKARKQQKRSFDFDFIKCGRCGMFVENTIYYNSHECEGNRDDGDNECSVKKQKTTSEQREPDNGDIVIKSLQEPKCLSKIPIERPVSYKPQVYTKNLPRSAFRFFMESFEKTCDSSDWFEIDRNGFQKWKDMTVKERLPYTIQSEKVDKAYQKTIKQELDEMAKFQTNSQDCSSDNS